MIRTSRRKAINSLIRLPKDNKDVDPQELIDKAHRERIDTFETKYQDRLALYYASLTGAIAAKWAAKFLKKESDLLAVGMLAMLEVLDKANVAGGFTHQHLSKHIHCRVNGAISNYVQSDFTVKPPFSTIKFIKKRQISNAVFERFDNILSVTLWDDKSNDEDILPSPAALKVQSEESRLIVEDCLKHECLDSVERKVMELTLQGYADNEISGEIRRTPQRVGQIRREAGRKLRCVITGKWALHV